MLPVASTRATVRGTEAAARTRDTGRADRGVVAGGHQVVAVGREGQEPSELAYRWRRAALFGTAGRGGQGHRLHAGRPSGCTRRGRPAHWRWSGWTPVAHPVDDDVTGGERRRRTGRSRRHQDDAEDAGDEENGNQREGERTPRTAVTPTQGTGVAAGNGRSHGPGAFRRGARPLRSRQPEVGRRRECVHRGPRRERTLPATRVANEAGPGPGRSRCRSDRLDLPKIDDTTWWRWCLEFGGPVSFDPSYPPRWPRPCQVAPCSIRRGLLGCRSVSGGRHGSAR